jgi:hypothetical protein
MRQPASNRQSRPRRKPADPGGGTSGSAARGAGTFVSDRPRRCSTGWFVRRSIRDFCGQRARPWGRRHQTTVVRVLGPGRLGPLRPREHQHQRTPDRAATTWTASGECRSAPSRCSMGRRQLLGPRLSRYLTEYRPAARAGKRHGDAVARLGGPRGDRSPSPSAVPVLQPCRRRGLLIAETDSAQTAASST